MGILLEKATRNRRENTLKNLLESALSAETVNRGSEILSKILVDLIDTNRSVVDAIHAQKDLLQAILDKEYQQVFSPDVQRVSVENPVREVSVLNNTGLDISDLLLQNEKIILLLEKIASRESLPQDEILGSDIPSTPTPKTIYRRIKNKTAFTEYFTYGGSGDVTLSRIPMRNTEKVYVGGERYKRGSDKDYTIIGKTITPVNSWPNGIEVVVDFDS